MTRFGPLFLLAISLLILPKPSQCIRRAACGPGRELQKDDWKCKRCQNGYYSDSYTTPCRPCKPCRHGVREKCTRKQNTVCHGKRFERSCVILLYTNRKKFEKHCKMAYAWILKECRSNKTCWLFNLLRDKDRNTVVESTTLSSATNTPHFGQSEKPTTTTEFTATTKTTYISQPSSVTKLDGYFTFQISQSHSTHSSGFSAAETDAHMLVRDDANYEEKELPSTDNKQHIQFLYYILITVVTLLAILFGITGSLWTYRKVKSRRKDGELPSRQFYWGSDTTIARNGSTESIFLQDEGIAERTITAQASQEQDHRQKQNDDEYELPVISCNTISEVDFEFENIMGRFQRSASVSESHSVADSDFGPMSNTLPLTKKERAIIFRALANATSKCTTLSSTSKTTMVRIISQASLFNNPFRSVLDVFRTSDDTIPLCTDIDNSKSICSYQTLDLDDEEIERVAEPDEHEKTDSLEKTDSSLGLSICERSPVLGHNSYIGIDQESAVSDSGVEDFVADAVERALEPYTEPGEYTDVNVANNQTTLHADRGQTTLFVSFINNLDIQKTQKPRPENISENLYRSEGTQTQHNSEYTRSIFGHPWNTCGHFTSEGGKLTKSNSDIVLDVPKDAVLDGKTAFIQGIFTVDLHDLQQHLFEDEVIVSPIAEFQMTYMERWEKFVKIVLPCIHRNPNETFRVRFYQRNREGDIEHGNVPPHDPEVNQEMFYVQKVDHVEIFTLHFTGFYCSVCGNTIPLELTALVFGCYGKHENEAWISLYIADKRVEITDFKTQLVEEERRLTQSDLCATREIRLLDQCDCLSRLVFSLKIRSQTDLWEVIGDPFKQERRLQELVKCSCPTHSPGQVTATGVQNNHACKHKLQWVFKPTGEVPPDSFPCTVHVEHVLSPNCVSERHDACDEGITNIPVPHIKRFEDNPYSMPKPQQMSQQPQGFAELPSSKKPMFSRKSKYP